MVMPNIINNLKEIVGAGSVLSAKEDLATYSYDGTTTWSYAPEVVVFPTTTDQVSRIMKLANDNLIPVTPRGAGTNISGGSVPVRGGIVLCTTKMNRVLDVNKANLTATVEPGVVLQDFNTLLAKENLFYPPDPQSFLSCTMGGTIAENSGGPLCVKYGVTKHYVLGLEVVLPDGYVMNIGGSTVKNRTGYDLVPLFTGSEGTLGIITRIILRLIPRPAGRKTIMAVFDDMMLAGTVVSNILANGIVPAKIEFVDNFVIRRIEEKMQIGLPVDANTMLLIDVDGSLAAIESEASRILDLLTSGGAKIARLAMDENEANVYWKARSAGFAAIYSAARTVIAEDVTVPRDRLSDFIKKLDEISKKSGFQIVLIGHAGDGNIHPSVFTNSREKEDLDRLHDTLTAIFEAALELGGTLSGEHGIGLEKKRLLAKALDPMAITAMKKIKAIFDPNNIMNPDKIWEA
ncbi:MAG TPA: FAD-linked oxidase C-terminal domain-containing protein [Acidobacteriota bacterium]|nr:FAD-linked oxidase C-terminal domain-containing protein [Acidobacteriota bacterium]